MADASAEDGTFFTSVSGPVPPVTLKTDVPHSARMYDYYLGGKDNFPVDRETAEKALATFPNGRTAARQNRAFMVRATRYLTAEAGLRQFLDVGTGIPTSPNLHEVAQSVAADARVVYADNDPLVLTYARALLIGTREGRTAYLNADVRDPEGILASAELRETLDLTQPVALTMISLLPFIDDTDDPQGLIRRLLDPLPAGSYLALTHITADHDPGFAAAGEVYRANGVTLRLRTRAEVERFFDGLDLVEPGVQLIHRWRPDGTADTLTDAEVSCYGAVARRT
jgi:SAM-dependent methyltransferase